jgi:hypothetical protein
MHPIINRLGAYGYRLRQTLPLETRDADLLNMIMAKYHTCVMSLPRGVSLTYLFPGYKLVLQKTHYSLFWSGLSVKYRETRIEILIFKSAVRRSNNWYINSTLQYIYVCASKHSVEWYEHWKLILALKGSFEEFRCRNRSMQIPLNWTTCFSQAWRIGHGQFQYRDIYTVW